EFDPAAEGGGAARRNPPGRAAAADKFLWVAGCLGEPFLEKFTAALTAAKPGDPTSADTALGPLSSSTAAERLDDQVRRAVSRGATLVAGGERDGNFYSSTVLTDITPDNPGYREEFFGPVAQVYRA